MQTLIFVCLVVTQDINLRFGRNWTKQWWIRTTLKKYKGATTPSHYYLNMWLHILKNRYHTALRFFPFTVSAHVPVSDLQSLQVWKQGVEQAMLAGPRISRCWTDWVQIWGTSTSDTSGRVQKIGKILSQYSRLWVTAGAARSLKKWSRAHNVAWVGLSNFYAPGGGWLAGLAG